LQQRDQLHSELGVPVYVGMRNWKPFVADAVRSMNAQRIQRAVAICMAPQNSGTSVGLYRQALTQNSPSFDVDFVESWHDQPSLIAAFAEKFTESWEPACRELGARVPVIFTAHSVPQRTISEGDPYEAQAVETARLVAAAVGLQQENWKFAFQSQGMSGGAWLGPTVEDTMRGVKEAGHGGVFIQPVGFVCDHVEVLYDIDIGFKVTADCLGLKLWRAESLNGSMLLTRGLAEIVRSRTAVAA
jgi:ferrochelatase